MRMLAFRRWLESLESSRLTDNTAIEGLKSAGQTARPPYIQRWEEGAGVLVKAYLLPDYKAIRHHFLDNLISSERNTLKNGILRGNKTAHRGDAWMQSYTHRENQTKTTLFDNTDYPLGLAKRD